MGCTTIGVHGNASTGGGVEDGAAVLNFLVVWSATAFARPNQLVV